MTAIWITAGALVGSAFFCFLASRAGKFLHDVDEDLHRITREARHGK